MRVFSVPAEYVRFIEASLAVAVADVQRDRARRAAGRKPTVADCFIDSSAAGNTIVMVGVHDAAQQARDLVWPAEPDALLITAGALP